MQIGFSEAKFDSDLVQPTISHEMRDGLTWPLRLFAGVEIVRRALRIPCYTIAFNAGVDANEVVQRVLGEKQEVGYDAMNGQYVDMMKSGIIDPTKV